MTPEQHVEAHRAAARDLLVDGIRTAVRDEGPADAPAVLCVHGVPASSFVWIRLLEQLAARGLRGVAPDLPGLGLAERPGPATDLTWSGLGRWLTAAVDALALDRIHLVVHDIGGPVGFELVDRVPDRIASLTILNTITDPARFTPPAVMRPFTWPVVDRLWLGATPDLAFAQLLRLQGVADRRIPRAELVAHRRLLVRDDGGRAFLRIMKGFELTEAASERHRRAIRSVVHRQVVWGERDPALTVDHHGEVARRVADVDVVHRLPGKHFLMIDQAPAIADRVAGLVARATA